MLTFVIYHCIAARQNDEAKLEAKQNQYSDFMTNEKKKSIKNHALHIIMYKLKIYATQNFHQNNGEATDDLNLMFDVMRLTDAVCGEMQKETIM